MSLVSIQIFGHHFQIVPIWMLAKLPQLPHLVTCPFHPVLTCSSITGLFGLLFRNPYAPHDCVIPISTKKGRAGWASGGFLCLCLGLALRRVRGTGPRIQKPVKVDRSGCRNGGLCISSKLATYSPIKERNRTATRLSGHPKRICSGKKQCPIAHPTRSYFL